MDADFTLQRLAELPRTRPVAQPRRTSLFLQRDFSDEALRQPIEPMFSAAEVAARYQEGYDAGYAAGHEAGFKEAVASRAAHQAAVEVQSLGVIAAAVADAGRSAATVADQAAEALAKTLIASMRAVMPALIERSAVGEINAMLAQVLPGLSREAAVRIEVAPDLTRYVAATVAKLAPEQQSAIDVVGIPAMQAGGARVVWHAGIAQRNPAQLWDAVLQALCPMATETEAQEYGNGN